MTIKEIEDQVRLIMLDTNDDSYRFECKELFHAIRDGIMRTRNIRPESKYQEGILKDLLTKAPGGAWEPFSIPDTFDASSLETFRSRSLSMEGRWRTAIVYYTCYRLYLKDDTDTQNANLAKNYLELYQNEVMT